MINIRRHIYQSPEGEGGGAVVADPPAAAPPPAPAPTAEPSPASAAPAAQAPAPAPAPAPAARDWPEDWRTKWSGGDEKTAKLMERYTTPADAVKALREVNVRISKGELKAPLKKDATPDETKAWRAEQGIPETPDKYDLALPDGLVLGDKDKPYVDAYVAALHAENASPAVVKAGVAAYVKAREGQLAAMAVADSEHKDALESELVQEWGHGDFKKNVGAIMSMLGSADSKVAATIMHARGPDGKAIANDPGVLRWLAGHARQLGYVAGTPGPSGADHAQTVGDEIKAIKAMQFNSDGSRNKAYWGDSKVQARYQELLTAQARLSK